MCATINRGERQKGLDSVDGGRGRLSNHHMAKGGTLLGRSEFSPPIGVIKE